MLSLFPFYTTAATTTAEVTQAMSSLKSSAYPQGNYWCGGNIASSLSYSGCGRSGSCTCNSFNRAYQCQGFALYIAQRVTGSYPAYSLSSYAHGATSGSWQCYTKSAMGTQAFCSLGLQPGDIVRAAYNSSYSSGHTAVVWKVENGKAYFAEVWGSVYCKINWGGFNYSSYSLGSICSKYDYVALWRNSSVKVSGECAHEYVTEGEALHPHRAYTKCTKCGKIEYTGAYVKYPDCVCCEGVHDYAYTNEAAHPHYEVKSCHICNNTVYTGNSTKDYSCPGCFGLPYNMQVSLSASSAYIGDEITVNYSADNALSYTVTVKCDGDKIVDSIPSGEFSHTFRPLYVGNYTVTVTAMSSDGKVNSVTSDILSVSPALTEVKKQENEYILRYDMSLDETAAAWFCELRGLVLTEYNEDHFFAAFELVSPVCEQVEQKLYSYIPLSLSFNEAKSFCELIGVEFVYSDSKETNEMLSELCVKAGSQGIFLNASDAETETVWLGGNGKTLSYVNWNASYDSSADRYKNFLFMYPGGSWTDSVAMPEGGHGFIIAETSHFGYNEKEDGSLELVSLPVSSSKTLTVPSVHEGKKVTSIGESAFDSCSFETVIIPDSVTEIAENAFDNAVISQFNIARGSEIEAYFEQRAFSYVYIMPFSDVKKGSWYYESMFFCYSNYYVSGTSETKFSPSLTCTREMFVTVLTRILGADTSAYTESSSFTDVRPGKWYSAAVEWAYDNGITSGIGAGKFGLGQAITREQIAVLLYNLAPEEYEEPDLSVFTDSQNISSWAKSGMDWAVSAGLIKGTAKSALEPKRTAMRSELCQMIYNYVHLKGDFALCS